MSLLGVALSETKVAAMKRAAESTSQSAPGGEARRGVRLHQTNIRRELRQSACLGSGQTVGEERSWVKIRSDRVYILGAGEIQLNHRYQAVRINQRVLKVINKSYC